MAGLPKHYIDHPCISYYPGIRLQLHMDMDYKEL